MCPQESSRSYFNSKIMGTHQYFNVNVSTFFGSKIRCSFPAHQNEPKKSNILFWGLIILNHSCSNQELGLANAQCILAPRPQTPTVFEPLDQLWLSLFHETLPRSSSLVLVLELHLKATAEAWGNQRLSSYRFIERHLLLEADVFLFSCWENTKKSKRGRA